MAEGPTFAFDVAAPVQAVGPQAPAQALFGFSGRGGSGTVPAAPGIDVSNDNSGKTLDVLMKLGSEYLAPHIAAARQQKAAEGMVAAMQGMSAATIQDDEVLGGLFGDSVTVAAARQVEKMDAVNRQSIDLSERMDELQKMDPVEFRSWYPKQMQQFMTGDPQSDALITQAFMERMPQTVDMHTKAHAKYRQEVARVAWADDLNTMGTALQGDKLKFMRGDLSSDLYDKSKMDFAQRLAGPSGISASAYPKWLNQAYKRFAADGNLAALDLIDEAGVLEATQDDNAFKELVAARDRAENRVAARSPAVGALMKDRGLMEAALSNGTSPFTTADEVLKWSYMQDADETAATGTGRPAYTNDQRKKLIESWVAGREKFQQRALRDASQDGAVDKIMAHRRTGTTSLLQGDPGYTAENKALADAKIMQDWSKEEIIDAAMKDLDYEWGPIKQAVRPARTLFQTGRFSPEAVPSLQFVNEMLAAGGEKLLHRYMGDDSVKAIALATSGVDFNDVDTVNKRMQEISDSLLVRRPLEDEKEVEQEIYNLADKGVFNTLNVLNSAPLAELNLTDSGRKAWARVLAPQVASIRHAAPHLSPEQATRIASARMQNRVDFISGVPFVSADFGPANTRTLHAAATSLLPKGPDGKPPVAFDQASPLYQRVIDSLVKEELAKDPRSQGLIFKQELTPTYFQWLRSYAMLNYINENGEDLYVKITPEMVVQRFQTIQAGDHAQRVMTYQQQVQQQVAALPKPRLPR